MKVETIPATVEGREVVLPPDVVIPKGAQVFIILVTDDEPRRTYDNRSPRLVNPNDSADFIKEVTDD